MASAAHSILTQSFPGISILCNSITFFSLCPTFLGEKRKRKKQHFLPLISQKPTSKTPVLLKLSLKILYPVVTNEEQYNTIQHNRYKHISNKCTWKLRTYMNPNESFCLPHCLQLTEHIFFHVPDTLRTEAQRLRQEWSKVSAPFGQPNLKSLCLIFQITACFIALFTFRPQFLLNWPQLQI